MIEVMGCLWQDTRSCLAVLRSVLQWSPVSLLH